MDPDDLLEPDLIGGRGVIRGYRWLFGYLGASPPVGATG